MAHSPRKSDYLEAAGDALEAVEAGAAAVDAVVELLEIWFWTFNDPFVLRFEFANRVIVTTPIKNRTAPATFKSAVKVL